MSPEIETVLQRVAHGTTDEYDAEVLREWLREQPGWQFDRDTLILLIIAFVGILIIGWAT